jgi:hypothetical protein
MTVTVTVTVTTLVERGLGFVVHLAFSSLDIARTPQFSVTMTMTVTATRKPDAELSEVATRNSSEKCTEP